MASAIVVATTSMHNFAMISGSKIIKITRYVVDLLRLDGVRDVLDGMMYQVCKDVCQKLQL